MSKKVIKTDARLAQDQVEEELKDSKLLQGDFGTRNYHVISARLQTTLAELDILLGTPAIVRPGFEQDDVNKEITIPSIFVKLDGRPANDKEYRQRINNIESSAGLQALIRGHFTSDTDTLIDEYDLTDILTNPTVNHIRENAFWSYDMLPMPLQTRLAEILLDLLETWPFTKEKTSFNRQVLVSQVLDMPIELMNMQMEVDYPKTVPLVGFLHQENLGALTFDDIVGLTVLHELGWDVVVFSPSGFSSLENMLPADEFDQFSYEQMKTTNLAKGDKQPSFWQKLFN